MTRLPCLVLALLVPALALGHGVAEGDQVFREATAGVQLGPFVYLGAKHMITGYDPPAVPRRRGLETSGVYASIVRK